MTATEKIALDNFLFDYPKDKSYIEILKLLKKESDDVQISSDFYNYEIGYLIEKIEILKECIINTLKEYKLL